MRYASLRFFRIIHQFSHFTEGKKDRHRGGKRYEKRTFIKHINDISHMNGIRSQKSGRRIGHCMTTLQKTGLGKKREKSRRVRSRVGD